MNNNDILIRLTISVDIKGIMVDDFKLAVRSTKLRK